MPETCNWTLLLNVKHEICSFLVLKNSVKFQPVFLKTWLKRPLFKNLREHKGRMPLKFRQKFILKSILVETLFPSTLSSDQVMLHLSIDAGFGTASLIISNQIEGNKWYWIIRFPIPNSLHLIQLVELCKLIICSFVFKYFQLENTMLNFVSSLDNETEWRLLFWLNLQIFGLFLQIWIPNHSHRRLKNRSFHRREQ